MGRKNQKRGKDFDMKPICILGMHRSGTSCLTGTLENAGLYLGNNVAVNTRENVAIQSLHDDILRYNNCEWDNITTDIFLWNDVHRKRRDSIIEGYGNKYWGFKDPRTVLLLNFWLEKLPMQFVGTFRHPILVVNSLISRGMKYNGERKVLNLDKALGLWEIYNNRLLFYYNLYGFPIINFDLSDDLYRKKLKLIIKYFHLKDNYVEYFDPERKKWKEIKNIMNFSLKIDSIYKKLLKISENF